MPLSLQYGSPAEKVESEKEISNSLDCSSDPIKLCHIDFFLFYPSSIDIFPFLYLFFQHIGLNRQHFFSSRKVREILKFCNFFFPLSPFFHLTSRFNQSLDRPFVLSRDFPRPCTIDQYPYSLCVFSIFSLSFSLFFFRGAKTFSLFPKNASMLFSCNILLSLFYVSSIRMTRYFLLSVCVCIRIKNCRFIL